LLFLYYRIITYYQPWFASNASSGYNLPRAFEEEHSMYRLSIALLVLVATGLLLGMLGCNALALSGEKKYKVDLQNALLRLQDEIEQNGEISDRAMGKLQAVLDKYQEEFGNNGSYATALKLIETANRIKDEPNNEFTLNQSVLMMIVDIQETLKTEIKD
jgi:hypothetical protein